VPSIAGLMVSHTANEKIDSMIMVIMVFVEGLVNV
jgi:hypothetical protein